jgi:PAS domain S-box-containing protein
VHSKGRIVFCNQRGLQLIGASSFDDIADIPVIDFVHPDYKEAVLERIKSVQVNHKSVEPFKEKFITLDGTILDVEVVGAPIKFAGETASLLVIRDISIETQAEEKLIDSEEKFRSLFEETRDAIYMTSTEGRIIEANKSFMDLFGYGEELLDINVINLYYNPEDRKKLQETISTHGYLKNYPLKLKKKNGDMVLCEMTSTLRKNRENKIIGYQGIIRDITAEAHNRDMMINAQKLDSLGTLAGGVAHDFNNLLMAIMGYINLAMIELPPDSPAINLIDRAISASENAGNLTRQLLAYSGKGRFILETQDINNVLVDIKRLLKIATDRSLNIIYTLTDNLPLVRLDTSQFTQLITNIVVNAYESTKQNDKTVTIATALHHVDEKFIQQNLQFPYLKVGNYVRISVQDTGSGMEEESLKKIFDPFYSTKFQGRGLGLAAVIGIVRSHKGAIIVSSEIGSGTKFDIFFPLST